MASIRRRGKVYQARWRTPTGEDRSCTRPTRQAAVAAGKRGELGLSTRQPSAVYPYRAGGPVTVAEFALVRWLPHHAVGERTRRAYARVLEKKILPELGSQSLATVTVAEARGLIRRLEAEGNSGPVIRQVRVVGSAVWTGALEADLAPGGNIWHGLKITVASPSRPRRILTPQEWRRLESECPAKWRTMLRCLLFSACRWSECQALTSRDIVGDSISIMRVRDEFSPHGRPGTKSGKSRSVPIPHSLAVELRAAGEGKEWIFSSRTGNVLRAQNWRRHIFRPACERAGITNLRIHDLRHTSLSWSLQGGASLLAVKERAGHSDISTTGLYLHTLPGAGQAGLDGFNAILDQ